MCRQYIYSWKVLKWPSKCDDTNFLVCFIYKCRLTENGSYRDIVFNIHGEEFPAHRCVLAARCDYFANLFRTRWKDRQEVVLNHHMVRFISKTQTTFTNILFYGHEAFQCFFVPRILKYYNCPLVCIAI